MGWDKAESDRIDSIQKTMTNIDVALNGKEDDSDSTGLIGQVQENTRFRVGITKKVNAVWVVLTGILSKIAYNWWIKEGGS